MQQPVFGRYLERTDIYIQSPDTHVDIQELYNFCAAEQASERGIAYPAITYATGKDPLGAGVSTGIVMELLGGWAIEWYAGNYVATVGGGTLVKTNSAPVFVDIVNSPQIVMTQSVASTIVNGNGVTVPSSADNATAVASLIVNGGLTLVQSMKVMNAVLFGRVSGAGSGVETFFEPNTGLAHPVCIINTDLDGNRTVVVLNA